MFFQGRLEKLLQQLKTSAAIPLRLELWNGRAFDLSPDPKVRITLPEPSALRYLLAFDLLTLGEAYIEGRIGVEGPILDVFGVGEQIARAGATRKRLRGATKAWRHSRERDRDAIRHHYDGADDFYALWLDTNRVYSCAYFKDGSEDLDTAQEQKLDHILRKLMLKRGERLLDIGCGWGALILRAAERYGAHATGITLSESQYEYASRRIRDAGLRGQCEVHLLDYRDLAGEGVYDKIVSVGMFEHVGLKNLRFYFDRIRALLKDGGLALNHGITSTDPDSRWVGLGVGEFIDRYVFPFGELPHLSLALREMSKAGLEAGDIECLRWHYAKTCANWVTRLERHREQAIALAGEKRYRIWELYLAGCAHGFDNGWISVYQILACKAGQARSSPLPRTRDYMYQ